MLMDDHNARSEDFRESFKELLQMQMQALISRSKIPAFENKEVDDLFSEIEQKQDEIINNYCITKKRNISEAQQVTVEALAHRVSVLETSLRMALERLEHLEKSVKS